MKDLFHTMKALVYYEPNNFKVEEKKTPVIKNGEVLLKVIACGICGTDLRIFTYGHNALKPPITTGHEIVGEVIEVKNKNAGVKIGDNVIVVTPVGCMKCKYCKKGMQNMCPLVANTVHSIGYYTDGGFAQYVRIPKEAADQKVLIKIPKTSVPLEHFALCEPLSCVMNGQEKLKIAKDDVVLVLGAGPIGTMHVYLAKAKGARKIILADLEPKKLKLAGHAPADRFVDSSKQDLKKIVMEETKNAGADVVVVAAPSGVGQEQAVELAAILGRISFFGGLPKVSPTITLQSNIVHYKELEIYGAFASHHSQYKEALNFILHQKIDTKKLVTHTLPLEKISEAIQLMREGKAMKIVITP